MLVVLLAVALLVFAVLGYAHAEKRLPWVVVVLFAVALGAAGYLQDPVRALRVACTADYGDQSFVVVRGGAASCLSYTLLEGFDEERMRVRLRWEVAVQ